MVYPDRLGPEGSEVVNPVSNGPKGSSWAWLEGVRWKKGEGFYLLMGGGVELSRGDGVLDLWEGLRRRVGEW